MGTLKTRSLFLLGVIALVEAFVPGKVRAAAGTNSPALAPLLADAAGVPIATRQAWLQERGRLKVQWQHLLGNLPDARPPLCPTVLATETLPGFVRQHVEYQVEPHVPIDGYLLIPSPAKAKFPAVVVFHPTTPLQAQGVAGVAATYPEEKWQGVQLVRHGYVVWCPRNYIFTEGADWTNNVGHMLAAHPGWTGITRMVWDAVRAMDYLETLPLVDSNRIGCLGHSLGGKEVLYAMAFDERYRVGVSSECGISLRFSNWDALWYWGPKIHDLAAGTDHHQLLALVAPRPFLLLAGDADDGEKSRVFLDTAKPVYELFGCPENLDFFDHHLGHRYAPPARQKAEEFLDRYLK